MKKEFNIICIIILFLSFCGCKEKAKKEFKNQYYSSGKLKSAGWYINDSIPIDTLYTYYESGKRSGMDIFDSLGYYIKAIGYYENGNMNELINYKNGLANGFWFNFYEDGKVKSKVYCLNDMNVGDAYFFDKNNAILGYNFYDWENHNINVIKYDSGGLITEDIRQKIFIDSIRVYNDSLVNKNENLYDLLLVISNPPKCNSAVKIDYLSKNNFLIKSDSVISEPSYFERVRMPDSLGFIDIRANQYDSIKRKTVYQKSRFDVVTEGFNKN